MLEFFFLSSLLLSGDSEPWEFAIIGDTQARPKVFINALAEIKKHNVKFVIHLGDMAYCGSKSLWRGQKKSIDKINIPFYYVIGNHELLPCRYDHEPTRDQWRDFWKGGYGTTFETFTYRNLKFIILDSAGIFTSDIMLSQLNLALSDTGNKSTFIFTHKPLPYPENFKIYYGEGGKRWHRLYDMSGLYFFPSNKRLWNTVYKYRDSIRAIFHGHYHAYREYTYKKIKNYCSGGGGGSLETKDDYYHFLLVKNWQGYTEISVIKIYNR